MRTITDHVAEVISDLLNNRELDCSKKTAGSKHRCLILRAAAIVSFLVQATDKVNKQKGEKKC